MRSKCVAAYPWIAFVLCALSGAAQQAGKTPEAAIEKPGATGTVLGLVAHDGHVINGGLVELLFADDHSPAGEASSSEEDPGFTLNFISDGDYILTSPMSSDIDYQLIPQPPGSLSPPIYEGHATHMYGSASRPLHVAGDMDAVTLAVPEPTAEEAQAFRDRLKQQEQQDQP